MFNVEQIDYKGYTINIEHDIHAEDPRAWGGEYGQMWCFHRRYNLGDYNDNPYDHRDFENWPEMTEQIERDHNVIFMSPLYLYDHGGITISMGSFVGRAQHARWDSGQVGFVVVTRDRVLKNQPSWKRITKERKEKLKEWVRGEVNLYDKYLRGECYGYISEDPSGEQIDSCWGFYGYGEWEENGLFEHAKSTIDWHINEQRKKYQDKLKTLIRNRVPLEKRELIIHKPKILSYVQ